MKEQAVAASLVNFVTTAAVQFQTNQYGELTGKGPD